MIEIEYMLNRRHATGPRASLHSRQALQVVRLEGVILGLDWKSLDQLEAAVRIEPLVSGSTALKVRIHPHVIWIFAFCLVQNRTLN